MYLRRMHFILKGDVSHHFLWRSLISALNLLKGQNTNTNGVRWAKNKGNFPSEGTHLYNEGLHWQLREDLWFGTTKIKSRKKIFTVATYELNSIIYIHVLCSFFTFFLFNFFFNFFFWGGGGLQLCLDYDFKYLM